jgi:hypothetical protein
VARSFERLATANILPFFDDAIAFANVLAIFPGPMIPQLKLCIFYLINNTVFKNTTIAKHKSHQLLIKSQT